jgi:Spy/CpxP family protein refolding chaperone
VRIAGALVVLALAAAAGAEGGQVSPAPPAEPRAERRGAREDALRMIDAYVVSNMQESLALTDEQFGRLLPLVQRLQSDRRTVVQRRQRAVMDLRRLLASGSATEARVGELLRDVKAAEAEERSVLARDRDAIDGVLTPVQQAKFRVFEAEVERKIRALMAQVRAKRRGQGGSRAPGRRPEP